LALIDSAFVSLVEMRRQGNKSPVRPLRVELKRKPAQHEENEAYYGCRVHLQRDNTAAGQIRGFCAATSAGGSRTFRTWPGNWG
jgi:hypothetical protein